MIIRDEEGLILTHNSQFRVWQNVLRYRDVPYEFESREEAEKFIQEHGGEILEKSELPHWYVYHNGLPLLFVNFDEAYDYHMLHYMSSHPQKSYYYYEKN